MKIKLLTSRCDQQGSNNFGDIIDLPREEALRYLNSGQAEAVPEPRIETAAKRSGKARSIKNKG